LRGKWRTRDGDGDGVGDGNLTNWDSAGIEKLVGKRASSYGVGVVSNGLEQPQQRGVAMLYRARFRLKSNAMLR